MAYTKEQRVINAINGTTKGQANEPKPVVSDGIIIPNKSGDHFRSYKRDVPTIDIDLANKKYVDDAITAAGHARQHSITSTNDHTSTATAGKMLKADANGLPVDATNTDAQVSSAVTKSHDRSHSITSTSDHTMGNNKIIHSKAAGAITEISLGASGTYLKSNGDNADMSFDTPATTALDNLASVAINTALISDTDDTDDLGSSIKQWKNAYIDGTTYTDAISLGGDIVIETDSTYNLGDSTHALLGCYTDNLYSAAQTVNGGVVDLTNGSYLRLEDTGGNNETCQIWADDAASANRTDLNISVDNSTSQYFNFYYDATNLGIWATTKAF